MTLILTAPQTTTSVDDVRSDLFRGRPRRSTVDFLRLFSSPEARRPRRERQKGAERRLEPLQGRDVRCRQRREDRSRPRHFPPKLVERQKLKSGLLPFSAVTTTTTTTTTPTTTTTTFVPFKTCSLARALA